MPHLPAALPLPMGHPRLTALLPPMAHALARVLAFALTLFLPTAHAQAGPIDYLLDPEGSKVGFEVAFNQGTVRGTMPVAAAEVTLDFDTAARSHARVIVNAAAASANVPFAIQAMKSQGVLDTARFPEITFDSTGFRRSGDTAEVTGNLTIRDVTRPVTLAARIFRPKGTDQGYRDALAVQLTGTVLRSDFGATGFADLVGDSVTLKILARIVRAP